MASIQLQIIRSGGQVYRETYREGTIAFGREDDNQIIFTETFVSRHHGHFLQSEDNWYIENLSPNGTQVNGKRIRKKPTLLNVGDTISVGNQQIFFVEAIESNSSTPTSNTAKIEPDSKANIKASPISPASRKMRLWISLAAFWLVVLGVLVFIQPLLSNKDTLNLNDRIPSLSPEQISQYVRQKPKDIQGNVQPDERRMNDALAEARDFSARIDASTDARYRAYRAYQRAIAYSGLELLPNSQDMRMYVQLEADLVRDITNRYYEGYSLLRSHNFRGAEQSFRTLIRYFPEPDNPLIRNVEAQRRDIGSKLRRS